MSRRRGAVVWLTGLPGAGKSTLARGLHARLAELGLPSCVLDGDELRRGLSRDLGFAPADRIENIRRAGEVARLMVDAGLIVVAAFVSPYAGERRALRERFAPGDFVEVFVDAPLEVVERRDPKGLYARARRGELPQMTGVDAPYEVPELAEVRVDTASLDLARAEAHLHGALARLGLFGPS